MIPPEPPAVSYFDLRIEQIAEELQGLEPAEFRSRLLRELSAQLSISESEARWRISEYEIRRAKDEADGIRRHLETTGSVDSKIEEWIIELLAWLHAKGKKYDRDSLVDLLAEETGFDKARCRLEVTNYIRKAGITLPERPRIFKAIPWVMLTAYGISIVADKLHYPLVATIAWFSWSLSLMFSNRRRFSRAPQALVTRWTFLISLPLVMAVILMMITPSDSLFLHSAGMWVALSAFFLWQRVSGQGFVLMEVRKARILRADSFRSAVFWLRLYAFTVLLLGIAAFYYRLPPLSAFLPLIVTPILAAALLQPIDRRDGDGETALMTAARDGDAEFAEKLLRRGADPARMNRERKTAIDLAREAGHLAIVSLLEAPAGSR